MRWRMGWDGMGWGMGWDGMGDGIGEWDGEMGWGVGWGEWLGGWDGCKDINKFKWGYCFVVKVRGHANLSH